MKQVGKFRMYGAAALATALLVTTTATSFALVPATRDELSLARGAIADVTPQQRYQSAIREAGGAHKAALRECIQAGGDERRTCFRDAQAIYDRDMADARLILRGRDPMQATVRD